VTLAYPYPDLAGGLFFQPPHNIMLDQAVAGMRFKLIGGYGWFPAQNGAHGVASPPVLKPTSVEAIFDAAYHGDGTPQTSPLAESNVTALRVFLRKYDVETVVVFQKGAYPDVVVSYVNAAIGAPVRSAGGVTSWFHVKQRLATHRGNVDCNADESCGTVTKVSTRLAAPANGATVSGTETLDAEATSYFGVTKVNFYLTGGPQHDTLIDSGRLTPYGWIAYWNTTSVANGTYTLRSVAYNTDGFSGMSDGVSISVSN
jgi:hypothetical protein